MAIAPNQGIMALPESQQMQAPTLSLSDSYDAAQQALMEARPDAYMEFQEELASIRPELEELTDEQIALLIEALQDLYNNPAQYAEKVQALVQNRFIESAEELPPEYNEEFIATLLMVLVDIQRTRQGMGSPQGGGMMPPPQEEMMPPSMMPPQQFARGGIAEAARMLASKGRNGDTMLAHITPEEARFLKARGGSGTINPETGLPEFWPLLSRKRGIGKTITKALNKPLGRVIATIGLTMILGPAGAGLSSAFAGAAASGLVTAAAGGDMKDVLKSAAIGFMSAPGGPVSNYLGKYTGQFLTNPVVREAANAAIIGTGVGLATGQNLKDSLKAGLTEGVISGGIAMMSGAPKIEVDNIAKNAAADATINGPKLPELDVPRGTRVSDLPEVTRTSAMNPDGTITVTAKDAMGNVKATEIRSAGGQLLSSSTPTTAPVIPSSTSTSGIFGTPQAKQAQTLAGQAAANTPLAQNVAEAVDFNRPQGPINYDQAGNLINTADTSPSFYDKVVDYFSPSAREKAGILEAEKAYSEALVRTGGDKELAKKAYEAAKPGFISNYGPITAAGIGALAMTGGFKPDQPQATDLGPTGEDLLRQDPSKYLIQGLPGVQYNAQGNITGSSPYTSPYTMADIRVPSAYGVPSRPPAMFAQGGIAALAQGGYPRRVGQISGPGTEKSDSIPAMLSDGEFVMTARAVRGAGGGSRREGAKRMYALMHQLERNAARG